MIWGQFCLVVGILMGMVEDRGFCGSFLILGWVFEFKYGQLDGQSGWGRRDGFSSYRVLLVFSVQYGFSSSRMYSDSFLQGKVFFGYKVIGQCYEKWMDGVIQIIWSRVVMFQGCGKTQRNWDSVIFVDVAFVVFMGTIYQT